MQNLLHRALHEFNAHIDNQKRDQKPGDILQPRVTKRVLLVGGFRRQLEAEQRHNRRAGVREIIHSVGQHRHAAKQQPHAHFGKREQQIDADPDQPAEPAVPLPHLRVLHISGILYEMPHQKIGHTFLRPPD